ncbi:MAG: HD domain-containing protein [Myxococcales bacterium]|nr:HD domain-containing protein [Myxococcales bacterium]
MRTTLPSDPLPCVASGFALLQLRAWARQASQLVGLGRPAPVDPESIAAPDSTLARRAEQIAEHAYDGHLLGHGHRTYAIGRAVGVHLGLRPDPEAFYVACLLHDVGLTEAHAGEGPFELRGAAVAHEACLPDERRAEVAHEAVAMHTSLRAAVGPAEVRLIQSGSGGDLVGLDEELMHPDTRRWIRQRWPKEAGFGARVVAALREQTRAHPASPGAALMTVGFAGRVRGHHRVR